MSKSIIQHIQDSLNVIDSLENDICLEKDRLEGILKPFMKLYVASNYTRIENIIICEDEIIVFYLRTLCGEDYPRVYIPFRVLLSDNPKEEKEILDSIKEQERIKIDKNMKKIDIENKIKALTLELKSLND